MSTEGCTQCDRAERGRDHRDCQCACHQAPGERERIAFHVHQFNHGCYGDHCAESDRLYEIWQAALARPGDGPGT